MLTLALLNTVVAYFLFYQLIDLWGATRTSLVTYAMPPIGVTLGALFLDETVDWKIVVGAALILGAIVVVHWHRRRTPAVISEPSRSARIEREWPVTTTIIVGVLAAVLAWGIAAGVRDWRRRSRALVLLRQFNDEALCCLYSSGSRFLVVTINGSHTRRQPFVDRRDAGVPVRVQPARGFRPFAVLYPGAVTLVWPPEKIRLRPQ